MQPLELVTWFDSRGIHFESFQLYLECAGVEPCGVSHNNRTFVLETQDSAT
jgi:hypothetical protein